LDAEEEVVRASPDWNRSPIVPIEERERAGSEEERNGLGAPRERKITSRPSRKLGSQEREEAILVGQFGDLKRTRQSWARKVRATTAALKESW